MKFLLVGCLLYILIQIKLEAVLSKLPTLNLTLSPKDSLMSEREQLQSMTDLQTSVTTTRGHLQNQLRKREGDCNRMAVQLRKMENQLEQQQIEFDHTLGLLAAAKEKGSADKEALKRATRSGYVIIIVCPVASGCVYIKPWGQFHRAEKVEKSAEQKCLFSKFLWLTAKLSYKMYEFWLVVCFILLSKNILLSKIFA